MDIKSDQKLKSFIKLVMEGKANIDSKSLMDEIENLHATREVRTITYKDVVRSSQKSILTATVQNQAYRSRLVEIKIKATRQLNVITEHKEQLVRYLGTTYSDSIKFRTKGERERYLETLVNPANALLAKLNSINELADLVIDDIDQAGWTVKYILQTLELSTRPERNI